MLRLNILKVMVVLIATLMMLDADLLMVQSGQTRIHHLHL